MAVVRNYMQQEQQRINNQKAAAGAQYAQNATTTAQGKKNAAQGTTFNINPVSAQARKKWAKIGDAQEYTLGADPGSYKSRYQGAMDAILQQIQNPDEFKYEFNGDELFKNYADLYTQYGKQASLDAMGQAAGLTGGYGNSYAQQAGQQGYQQYLLGLYDKGFDLRNMAYQGYRDQLNDLYNTYNLYAQAEAQDYARYQDAQNAYLQMLAMMPQGGGGGGGNGGGKKTVFALGNNYFTYDKNGNMVMVDPNKLDPSQYNVNTLPNALAQSGDVNAILMNAWMNSVNAGNTTERGRYIDPKTKAALVPNWWNGGNKK